MIVDKDEPPDATPTPTREEAIAAAESAARTTALAGWEEEKARILANSAEKDADIRKAREARKTAEDALAAVKLKADAAKDGHDPDEFEKAVTVKAGELDAVRQIEWEEIRRTQDGAISDLTAARDAMGAEAHRSFVGWSFVEGMLGDRRIVHDGYMPDVIDKLSGFVFAEEIDGRTVPVLKTKTGTRVPGKGANGMTLAEYANLQLAGKSVPGLPDIGVYLVDKSRSANVTEVSAIASDLDYGKMTESERIEAIKADPVGYQAMVTKHAQQLAANPFGKPAATN